MNRILLINPNTSDSVSQLIGAEAQRAASADTQIDVLTAPFGVAYIETRSEALIGGYAALQLAAEHYTDYDAIIVAAFGDPGLEALREALPIPVIGMTEAALATATQSGGKTAIIAISQRIQAWYRECSEREGFGSQLCAIRALDQTLANIGTVQEDQGERLIALAELAVTEDHADNLILAGAPLAGLARAVAHRLPVPAFDGVSCAVRQAEALVNLTREQGTCGFDKRQGSFARPPEKPCQGLSPALSALIGRR